MEIKHKNEQLLNIVAIIAIGIGLGITLFKSGIADSEEVMWGLLVVLLGLLVLTANFIQLQK